MEIGAPTRNWPTYWQPAGWRPYASIFAVTVKARIKVGSFRVSIAGILSSGTPTRDVAAAYEFLLADGRVDSDRIAVVAASYSGEESVEAGRTHGYAAAYVLLSPGSLSGESIGLLDPSPAQWLIIAAREDPHLADIMAEVSERSERAETLLLDGAGHATDLLEMESDLPSRLVDWLLAHLQ